MALVGEGVLDTPILAATLEEIPDAELRLEEIRALPDDRLRFLIWADETHCPEFEAALATDDTIRSFRLLTSIGDQRLYRLALSEVGREVSTYLAAAEEDIVVLELTVSVDGMRFLARIPSRDALRSYAEACQQRGVRFQLERLFEEDSDAADQGAGGQSGLTATQCEALRRALDMGYFEVPRETSINEIAEELDVSSQALSTLLRRAEKRLIQNTVTEGGI